jgi:hypothetical protein
MFANHACSDGTIDPGPFVYGSFSVSRAGRFDRGFSFGPMGEFQGAQARIRGAFGRRGRSVSGNYMVRYSFTDGLACGVAVQFSARTRSR